MTPEELWARVRRGYARANALLEQFYHHGPAAHGVQGVVREFLDGPPDGVQISWSRDRHGPICSARDVRGTYRIELQREDGRWSARACSCLGFQEFQRECRHLRAARQALAFRDGQLHD
jgi:hypothetical protein